MVVFATDEEVRKFLEETSEEEVVWVCGSKRLFPDDIEGKCEICGKKIYHRPYAKGKKLCIKCGEKDAGLSIDEMIERAIEEHKKRIRKALGLKAM